MNFKNIFQHSFYKPFLILLTGTFIAQAIQLISYPILARLFTPDDFGIKAFFSTTLLLITTLSTGKYELAITLPKKNEDAASCVFISFILGTLTTLIVIIILLFIDTEFLTSFLDEKYWSLLWLMPVGVFGISMVNPMIHWVVRLEAFKFFSKIKVFQSSMKFIFEITGGLLNFGVITLIIGLLIGTSGGMMFFFFFFIKSLRSRLVSIRKAISRKQLLFILQRFKEFPTFSILSGFLNNLNNHFPILFFTFYSTMNITGQYSIASVLILVPYGILIDSFSQVYLSKMATLVNTAPEQLYSFYESSLSDITKISVFPILVFAFLGKPIVLFLFGDQWELAGNLLSILSIYFIGSILFFLSFHIFNLLELQKTLLGFNLIKCLTVFVGFCFSYYFELTAIQAVIIYVGICFVISLWQLSVAQQKLKTIANL